MNSYEKPLRLKPMRVVRTYTGGKLLDAWQGISPAVDGHSPEEWVASTITSRFADDPNAGLSILDDGSAEPNYLRDHIAESPREILGKRHFDVYGESSGFLAKLIDSENRLNIQAHPDREKAREYFNSPFGKTEAWYIIETREIEGQPPYILLGFKPGITKQRWKSLVNEQDIEALEDCLHRIPVTQGEVYLVESGMPHAIGSGCLLAEIQEPTDFTFRVEKMTLDGVPYPEEVYHQGIGYERMFDCFHYSGFSYSDTLSRVKVQPEMLSHNAHHELFALLTAEHTPCFSMKKLTVRGNYESSPSDVFCTAVVIGGRGTLQCETEALDLARSNELFLPASQQSLIWESKGDEELEVLLFYPPSATSDDT